MSIAPTEAPIATLTLCAHDYQRHSAALAPYVSMVIDERWQLAEHIKDDKGVR